MEESHAHLLTGETLSQPRRCQVAINILPNDVLLDIFDFSLSEVTWRNKMWIRLAHVCQKWRKIVFSAPRRLNLELVCTDGKPVMDTLYVWLPKMPIKMFYYGLQKSNSRLKSTFGDDVENIIEALEHKDRICEMSLLNVPSSEMGEILAEMQEPFPALKGLKLRPSFPFGETRVVEVPDSFLGGSAPSLRTLCLNYVLPPFLRLQKLLLSASGLTSLHLENIPDSVYFSPDAIVTCLSALTKLEDLEISFQSPRSRPARESRHPPPLTRVLLPALTCLTFQGVCEYLEDLVAQIDAPQLQALHITFFYQLFFPTLQLPQFIGRAPRLKGYDQARVCFTHSGARVTLRLPLSQDSGEKEIRVGVSCKHPDLQLSSLVQFCTLPFPQTVIPAVKHLYVLESREYGEGEWENDAEDWENNILNSELLQLLHPFIAVKNFYISEKFVPFIAPALRELVGERITEALPALECLFLDGLRVTGPVWDAISPFVAARQFSTHPVVVSYWDCDDEDWYEGDD